MDDSDEDFLEPKPVKLSRKTQDISRRTSGAKRPGNFSSSLDAPGHTPKKSRNKGSQRNHTTVSTTRSMRSKECGIVNETSEGTLPESTGVQSSDDESFRTPIKNNSSGVEEDGLQHCPCCQMPFRGLVGQSPRWHVMECLEMKHTPVGLCPEGLDCSSSSFSHFKRFSHQELALVRTQQVKDTEEEAEACSPKTHNSTKSTSASLCSKKLNFMDKSPGKLNTMNSLQDQSPNEKPTQVGHRSSSQKNDAEINSPKHNNYLSQQNRLQQSGVSPSRKWSSSNNKLVRSLVPGNQRKVCGGRKQDRRGSNSLHDKESTSTEDDNDKQCESDEELFATNYALADKPLLDDDTQTVFPPNRVSKHNSYEKHDDLDDILSELINEQNLDKSMDNKSRNGECLDCDEETCNGDCTNDKEITNIYDINDSQSSQQKGDSQEHSRAAPSGRFSAMKNGILGGLSTIDNSSTAGSQGGVSNSQKQSSLLSFFKQDTNPFVSKNLKQKDLGVYFGLKPLKKPSVETKIMHKTIKQNTATKRWNNKGGNMNDLNSETSESAGKKKNRKCPFYKRIPGTDFVVDAFQYGVIPGVTAYFLSHFHYDHYGGLTKKFAQTLYCSKITANLVKLKVRVDARYIKPLELNQPIKIDNTTIVPLEANHCPGAVMFLFTLPNGRNILHTGDFRASAAMEVYPHLANSKINELFLDTTYCNPQYSFPSQQETVEFAVSVANKAVRRNPRILIVCGSYTIGKEKVFLGVAHSLGCKVCVKMDKKRILECLECDTVKSLLTTDPAVTRLHVIPMGNLTLKTLGEYLQSFKQYNEILAFEPTGWTHNEGNVQLSDIKPVKRGAVTKYGIPYSEHSGYSEMERFVKFVKPGFVIQCSLSKTQTPSPRRLLKNLFIVTRQFWGSFIL